MDIKSGLKSFRLRKGFNQEDLAKALGVNQQNISLWEAGRGYPSYLVLKKLLEIGAMVEEVFGIQYAKMHLNPVIETTNKELGKIMGEWRATKSKIDALDDLGNIVKQSLEKIEMLESKLEQLEKGG
jgi:transcriptional regulator with XRE-family HTH domain